ncbi:MAG: hypothetical protein L0Y36_00925 [Planctomycetales bacterium]|nr:hypothetical protein [Planctomycetales bacterium]
MVNRQVRIQNYIAEYFVSCAKLKNNRRSIQQVNLKKILVKEHDWTTEGATCLIQLVHDYGSFILGNAYALSIVLGKEDGDVGLWDAEMF